MAAAVRLAAEPAPETPAGAKRAVVAAIQDVAAELGNTPAVCRSSYVHPVVLTAFAGGTLRLPARRVPDLSADEAGVLAFLRAAERSRPP